MTKQGRKEVPIPVLLELQERVAEQRSSGQRRLHALEPVMMEGRQSADQLREQGEPLDPFAQESPHRVADLHSLAYHRAVAARLRRSMVEEAQRKLRRWETEGKIDPRHAKAWKEVFDLPMEKIREAITVDDEPGRDLRQNSPFA